MSFNRENVIWESFDGTWNRAFYDFVDFGGGFDDDYDPEWDVEYLDKFNWVKRGMRSQDEADACWKGANPGGFQLFRFADDPDYVATLDARADEFLKKLG